MAQAARLNLRMQKELKLLLTDPPPGASFPSLSSSSSSFTSIDALLQGPEGSVYANGAFKIKIQIPERYPFQPPIVTFATPIYHPNIDNGGRICLDILNLPPKGSWQPSLNISTVLTSIGLLLAEPNPDDGLMHDASREYKYNRQAFDQKARAMSETHARAGKSDSAPGIHENQTHTFQSTPKTEEEPVLPSVSSRNILLESLGSSSSWDSGKGIEKLPASNYPNNSTEIGLLKEGTECNRNPDKPGVTRNKLSLKVPVFPNSRNGENEKTDMPPESFNLKRSPSPLVPFRENPEEVLQMDEDNMEVIGTEDLLLRSVKTSQRRDSCEKLDRVQQLPASQPGLGISREALTWPLDTNQRKKGPDKDAAHKTEICPATNRLEKVGSVESKRSFGPFNRSWDHPKDEKDKFTQIKHLTSPVTEQVASSCALSSAVSENSMYGNKTKGKQLAVAVPKLSGTVAKLPLEKLNLPLGNNNSVTTHSDSPSNPYYLLHHMTDEARSDQEHTSRKNELYDKEETRGSPIPDSAIVLDSEDSGDETVPVRSRLSLARKHLLRKRKSNG